MLRLRLLNRSILNVGKIYYSSTQVEPIKETEKNIVSESKATEQVTTLPGGPLAEFFDREENFGKSELRPKQRPGREWTIEELQLKSNSDLHKLWYVLLKEKNMLLTMEHAYKIRNKNFPNPERLDRVEMSMENIEKVVHERNDAYLRLETGEGADIPERTVTSFAGFTYKKQSTEHLLPHDVTGDIEYEQPMLSDEAYITQKLWAEKQYLKEYHKKDQERFKKKLGDSDFVRYQRSERRTFNCVEQLPK